MKVMLRKNGALWKACKGIKTWEGNQGVYDVRFSQDGDYMVGFFTKRHHRKPEKRRRRY